MGMSVIIRPEQLQGSLNNLQMPRLVPAILETINEPFTVFYILHARGCNDNRL